MNTQRLVTSIIGVALLALSSGAVVARDDAEATIDAMRPPMASAGCGGPAPAPGTTSEGSLIVNGSERTWRIHVPPAHDGLTPLPLVVLLHGLGEDAGIIRNFTTSGLPDDEGFVIVAPLGSGMITRWMWDLDDTEYDLSLENPDIAFIDALIERLGASLCLDESRIYAAGYSNGAIGVSALGCVLEDRIAAIAAVSALTDFGDACIVDRPVPTLGIHGTDDPYVLFEGGWGPGVDGFMLEDFVSFADQPIASWPGFRLSFPDRAAGIAERNGCATGTQSEPVSEDVERLLWDCPSGGDVELLVIDGGNHAWPVVPLDAASAIWDFFSRQALPPPPAGASRPSVGSNT
jgi:polyhydroxybutyrate depolymerase